MRTKIITICLVAGLLFSVASGAKTEKKQQKETLSKADVMAMYNEINTAIIAAGQKQPLGAISYKVYVRHINNLLKDYPYIEADTEIDKTWYERTVKFIIYMGECRDYLDSIIKVPGRPEPEQNKKIKNNFDEAQKRFAELIKEPTPVEKRKLEKLREEKHKWELTQKSRKSGGIKEDE
ncbi:MAG: hypothetical protein WC808_06950 [Patescibacteria group bacterium]|jgi:hypothetical protein